MITETLHDDNPHDVEAWQRAETLAEALAVSTRTIRNMVQRGQVERLKVHGRVYYRAVRPDEAEATGIPGKEEASEAFRNQVSEAAIERLQGQLIELAKGRAADVERLHEALGAAKVEAARFQAERDAAERDRLRLEAELKREESKLELVKVALERERQRRELAEVPWYAWRRRRRQRDVTLPSLLELPSQATNR